eukprot:TRINITY_DN1511_c0_g1_i2.p1 TRINITY_DN1511_c0_g1~~TRINITY_DN1511_c0_g1_i2.p1  ORF type:complete len:125 (-),score=14.48 TRINITY_DN1511_c0_g1_i2:916-1290(-)
MMYIPSSVYNPSCLPSIHLHHPSDCIYELLLRRWGPLQCMSCLATAPETLIEIGTQDVCQLVVVAYPSIILSFVRYYFLAREQSACLSVVLVFVCTHNTIYLYLLILPYHTLLLPSCNLHTPLH